jgi:hypothetical protein
MANVAIDLFADPDPSVAVVEAKAAYEIMVWIALIGDPKPLGFYDSQAPALTQVVNSIQL